MTNAAAAARYARALLEVGLKEGDPQQIEQELAGFQTLVTTNPRLEQVLRNPAIPAPHKRALVSELSKRIGLSPIASKLLALLAERDRLALLPDLLESYRTRLLDHLKIIRAEVTTAAPLPSGRTKALERSLAQLTGKQVTLAARVDPSIIGGVVARIGSTVYDGSITRQLERLREKLIESA